MSHAPHALPFALPERIVARAFPASYAACLRSDASSPIDMMVAPAQHAAYLALLRTLVARVDVLPTDDACPDACFIEDTAVFLGSRVVATRPGAPSRRGEVAPVAEALARDHDVQPMDAPATLDGGDVLRVGARLLVGLSSRTNRAGVESLARLAARDGIEVLPLAVRGGLHLKSACTLASATLVVYDPHVITDAELAPIRSWGRAEGLELLAVSEPAGANVLALGGAVVVSAAAPSTAEALARRGLDVRVVDVSEIHKGDGALTCLSLRVPATGTWCT